MKVRGSYGQPPLFVTALFLKVLVVTMAVVLAGLVGVSLLLGPMTRVDLVGTLICTPLVAYLVHLWLAPGEEV